MAIAEVLVDTSALGRLQKPPVRDALVPLIRRGLVATCGMVDAEAFRSARNVAEHDRLRGLLAALEWLPTPDEVWDRVLAVQRGLTERGLHRSVPIPDLVIVAVAKRHGLAVLHYDADYDAIGGLTGQAMRWVVPTGSAD